MVIGPRYVQTLRMSWIGVHGSSEDYFNTLSDKKKRERMETSNDGGSLKPSV